MRTLLTRAMSALTLLLLRLRYRLDVRGLEAIAERGRSGILFLPNHSALVDPVVMVALLHRRFAPRPLADEHQVTRTAFGRIALLFGSRVLPNLERDGVQARSRMREQLTALGDDLKAGENILLYPAGRLKRHALEDIGSASGTATIIKAHPDIRIVLVRHTGLWGSSFSLAYDGTMPSFGGALVRGLKGMFLSGIVFMPRRRLTVEFVEPDDIPRRAGRHVINRYLERFYNAAAAPNTYVPYSIWERGGTRVLPEPVYAEAQADASSVPPATRDLVLAHLRRETDTEHITLTQLLGRDLGMDSLAVAELVVWIEEEFGFSTGTPDSLRTVADAVLAAAGQGVSAAPVELKPIPRGWYASRGSTQPVAFPPGDTLTQVFLRQAAMGPGRPVLADQTSGVRTYRDLITALLVLKPRLEQFPGDYVGIMLPASVGASVFTMASMFAGKTPVMVNWTTGVRTIRHSLELLGVSRVITARALVSKLASLGIDMADLRERFVFVEDILGGITTGQKLSAAVRARLSWAELELVEPRNHAVVLFTSGSETLPKAVPLSHRNLLANGRDILEMGRLLPDDVVLGMLPPFHSFGMTTTVLLPLCTGLRTVYHTNPTESAALARLIEAYRASVVFATPTFLGGIARVGTDRQLASLRLAVTGAERCPDQLNVLMRTRFPGVIVLEGYGITECSPVVSCSPMDAPVPGSIGRLLPHVEGAVVDLTLTRRAALHEQGLLLVRGPSVFAGYLHHTGDSPFVEFEGKTWYQTGDLVRATVDGILYFEGRLKRFVKLGGEMVSLPAIESVLQRRMGEQDGGPVVAVEALGNPDGPDIVLFTTVPIDRGDANAQLKEAGLSALHNIRQVVRVEAIPLLGTGKTDYRTLKARYEGVAPEAG